MSIEDSKIEFLNIFNDKIQRDGKDVLLNWLEKTDFFYAPASTRYHSAYEGGLVKHSVNVYKRLLNLIKNEYGENYQNKVSDESIAIMGLLHDICKVNCYKEEMRNVKENGSWIQKPYYAFEDGLPYGHGEKSVYVLSGFMKLSREEAMAINWHMGGFDSRTRENNNTIRQVFNLFPIALFLNVADLQSSYLDE